MTINKVIKFILIIALFLSCFTPVIARDNSKITSIEKDTTKYSDDSSNFVVLSEAVPDVILEIRYN